MDALRVYLLKNTTIINVETTQITNSHLFEYLEFIQTPPQTMPNKSDKKQIFITECAKHFPDYLLKLYQDDEAEFLGEGNSLIYLHRGCFPNKTQVNCCANTEQN